MEGDGRQVNEISLKREHIDNHILEDLSSRIYNWDALQRLINEYNEEITRLNLEIESGISEERKRSIQDTLDKLGEAKSYANEQVAILKEQAAIDATSKADKALEDSKAYMDGKVKTDVPSGAKFTDTTYKAGANINIDEFYEISVSGHLGLTRDEVRQVKVDKAGDADTVTGFSVGSDVPPGAKFTDTKYDLNPYAEKQYVDEAIEGINVPEDGLTPAEIRKIKVESADDADTVSGHTVAANVPVDAVFTDTRYNLEPYAKKQYVDEAIEGIRIPEGGLTPAEVKKIKVDRAGDADTVGGMTPEELTTIKSSEAEPELPVGGQWHRERVL